MIRFSDLRLLEHCTMPEGQTPVKDEPEKAENEQAAETVTEADVLEEDDDFEDFEDEGQ